RPARDDRELVGREVRGDDALEQGRGLRSELARLEQDAIPRRKRRNHWEHRQLERIVPRANDADHAERLAQNAAAARPEIERRGRAPRPHPAGEMPARMADAGADQEQLREPSLPRRTRAEIGGDGGNDLGFMPFGQLEQAMEPVAPNRERRAGLGGERPALRGEALLEFVHGQRTSTGGTTDSAGFACSIARTSCRNSRELRSASAAAARRRSTASGGRAKEVGWSLR